MRADKSLPEPPPTEIPIEAYEERNGRPYLVDMLDVANLYIDMGYKGQVADIDRFIQDEIVQRSLESTKASYESIMNRLESELMLDPNLSFDKRLEKLSAYTTILVRQRELETMRMSLLNE